MPPGLDFLRRGRWQDRRLCAFALDTDIGGGLTNGTRYLPSCTRGDLRSPSCDVLFSAAPRTSLNPVVYGRGVDIVGGRPATAKGDCWFESCLSDEVVQLCAMRPGEWLEGRRELLDVGLDIFVLSVNGVNRAR